MIAPAQITSPDGLTTKVSEIRHSCESRIRVTSLETALDCRVNPQSDEWVTSAFFVVGLIERHELEKAWDTRAVCEFVSFRPVSPSRAL